MVFLAAIVDQGSKHIFLVGFIPFMIGVALAAYAYLLAPKEGGL